MSGKILNPYPNAQTPFEFWAAPVYTAADGTYYTPGFTGNTYMSNVWDYCVVNGVRTPGKVLDVKVVKGRDVDKKKAAGSDGARNTIHGVDPGSVEISIMIWTPEQLRQLQKMWDLVFPVSGKGQPQPWDTQHPKLKFHHIKSLQFFKGEGPDPGPIVQSRVFTMHSVEFMPPGKKKATVTPVASKGSLLDPGRKPTAGSNSNNWSP